MSSLVGGVIAFFVGTGLAAATVVGVVQARSATTDVVEQQGAGDTRIVEYGTNE